MEFFSALSFSVDDVRKLNFHFLTLVATCVYVFVALADSSRYVPRFLVDATGDFSMRCIRAAALLQRAEFAIRFSRSVEGRVGLCYSCSRYFEITEITL